ncbi:MAG: helix-turn-helix transcriptional regulator [Proteobacteria bacterium]|nr:helix-turn-helix transcriptional regulator [Pseudomonadota bacterium]
MAHLDRTFDIQRRPFDRPAADSSHLHAAQRRVVAVERAISFMRGHLAEPLTLNGLADIAHCSPWHFDRVFSEIAGMSPLRYLSHLRIEAAKLAVMESDRRIIDIAFSVGYNSLGSFGKRFTELVGLAPSQLRRAVDDFDIERWRSGLDQVCLKPAAGSPAAVHGDIGFDDDPRRAGWAMIAAVAAGDSILNPAGCALAAVPGRFALHGLAPAVYSLVAIGFDRTMAPTEILTQQSATRSRRDRVTVHPGGATTAVRLTLRRPEASDAPIVPPFAIVASRAAPDLVR